MPAGRPRNHAGAGDGAPILFMRQTAEDEAALNVIRFDAALAAGHGWRMTAVEAARHALRAEALRLAGPERLERATALMVKKRRRAG